MLFLAYEASYGVPKKEFTEEILEDFCMGDDYVGVSLINGKTIYLYIRIGPDHIEYSGGFSPDKQTFSSTYRGWDDLILAAEVSLEHEFSNPRQTD